MLLIDGAPLLDRRRDRGEVVVGQYHLGRLLRDLGALDPHGDADVGFLERRCVVNAVACQGHDLLIRLDRLDKTELVLGARPREHVDVADPFLQRGRVHFRDFGTGDGCLSVADIEHLCDRRCGNFVIAR